MRLNDHHRDLRLQPSRIGYSPRCSPPPPSLAIPDGKVVDLVGPNGAGKSTLLQLSVGLLGPSAGSISVLGHHPGTTSEQLARVGFVAQDTPTYAGLSIAGH